MEQGVDCLRINPGNIGSEKKVRTVVSMAADKNIPIQVVLGKPRAVNIQFNHESVDLSIYPASQDVMAALSERPVVYRHERS